jgi:hypothetical protein
MQEVTVDRLIEVLKKVKDEVGGECVVNLFCGNDYDNPISAKNDGYTTEITDVMVMGAKSFMSASNCSRKLNDENVNVWIKYA